jgi:hypothetical protein
MLTCREPPATRKKTRASNALRSMVSRAASNVRELVTPKPASFAARGKSAIQGQPAREGALRARNKGRAGTGAGQRGARFALARSASARRKSTPSDPSFRVAFGAAMIGGMIHGRAVLPLVTNVEDARLRSPAPRAWHPAELRESAHARASACDRFAVLREERERGTRMRQHLPRWHAPERRNRRMRRCSDPTHLSQRHEWLKNVSVLRALLGLLLVTVAGAALTVTSCSSGPTYRCEGKTGECSSLAPEQCSADIGCPAAATPLCVDVGYSCARKVFDEVPCLGEHCRPGGTLGCTTTCEGAADEATCAKEGGRCAWLDGKCMTPCQMLTDHDSCRATAGCLWLACGGKPRACEEFSGDACPTWLGCDKVKSYAYSAQ